MSNEEFALLIERELDGTYAPFKRWNKDEVANALLTLFKNKPNVVTGDIPMGFYRRVNAHFGGMKQAKDALGISPTVRKSTPKALKYTDEDLVDRVKVHIANGLALKEINECDRSIMSIINKRYGKTENFENAFGIKIERGKRKQYKSKYSDELLNVFITRMHKEDKSGSEARDYDSKLFSAAAKRYGTWNKALGANGLSPKRRTPRKDWTKDELIKIYRDEIASGVKREDVSNSHAIVKLFGTIRNLRREIGEVRDIELELLSKESIERHISQALLLDVDELNKTLLDSINVNLTYSIQHHYGSTSNYFSSIDIDRYKKPHTPFTWTKENIVWQLERWIREGYPVNYTAVQSKHKGIIVASRRIFGSYKKAFEFAGLNYAEYRVDSAMASRYGFKFEKIVEQIFDELHLEYKREPAVNGCHPDFVFGEHWVDAKLSEWTVSFSDCSTIHKYLPNCRRLSIVYLRKIGGENLRTNSLGVDMIHVSELVGELPPTRARYFTDILDAIEFELSDLKL